jgi:hypothetical protein
VIDTSDSGSRHLLPPNGNVIATHLLSYAPKINPSFNAITVSTGWGGDIKFITVGGYTNHLRINAYQYDNHYKMDFILMGHTVMQIANDQGNQYLRVSGTVVHSSDDRLKHNEKPVEDACNTISKLSPLFYDRTSEFYAADYTGPVDNSTKDCGFIAQEVEMIPELKQFVSVPTDESIAYALNYNALFCVNVAAVQELIVKVSAQDSLIASLMERLTVLEQKN